MSVLPSGHLIIWSLSHGSITGRLMCVSEPTSWCCWESECGCEEFYGMAVDEEGPYHLYTDFDEMGENEVKHRMTYGGECQVENWVNSDDVLESVANGVDVEIGTTFVEAEWQGDHFLWTPSPRARAAVKIP